MSAPPKSGLANALTLLGPGPFRRYMMGEAVSMTGTWMQMMAQSFVMTTLTSSAFMLGVVNFASGLPMLLLSMAGGSAADRFDKRTILFVCLGAQMLLALLVGTLVSTKAIALWHLIAVSALLGVVSAYEMPAVSALVPELVPKERIKDAIALDRSLFHATRLVGPAAAGGVIALWGNAVAFFVNAVTFLPLMAALMTLPKRQEGTAEEEEARAGGMGDAVAFVRQDRPTLAMVALVASTTFFVFPTMLVMMPLYVTNELKLGAGAMGVMMSTTAVGSLLGSMGLMGLEHTKRRGRLMLGSVGAAASLLSLAAAQHMAVAALSLTLMAVSLSTLVGLSNTIVIERTPEHLRGRVSALTGIASFGMMPFAGLGVTAYADVVGMRAAIATGAVCFAVVSGLLLLNAARHTHDPLPLVEDAATPTEA